MRRSIAFLICGTCALAALTACTTSTVVMQDPHSRRTAACQVMSIMPSMTPRAMQACEQAYEKAGWRRLAE